MKRLAFFMAIFIIHFCGCTIAPGQRLWVDEVNIKSENGKDLIMKFEEIERKDEYSIARVTHTSGASVASVMFVSKGFYNIAKQRGKKYYINLKEWHDADKKWMYKVGFVDSKDIDLKKIYGSDIKENLNDKSFFSVEDDNLFFGKK